MNCVFGQFKTDIEIYFLLRRKRIFEIREILQNV